MASEKAEMDALKKECDGLRTQIEVRCSGPAQIAGAFRNGCEHRRRVDGLGTFVSTLKKTDTV